MSKTVYDDGPFNCEAIDDSGEWRFYGQRDTLIQAKKRIKELQSSHRFKSLRIRKRITIVWSLYEPQQEDEIGNQQKPPRTPRN